MKSVAYIIIERGGVKIVANVIIEMGSEECI